MKVTNWTARGCGWERVGECARKEGQRAGALQDASRNGVFRGWERSGVAAAGGEGSFTISFIIHGGEFRGGGMT
jgi:hypothetical protein